MRSSAPAIDARAEALAAKDVRARTRRITREREWRLLTLALILNDLLMAGIAFRIAYWLRFELGVTVFEQDALASRTYYELVVVVLTPIWLVIFAGVGLYQRDHLLGGTDEYSRVLRGTSIGVLFVVIAGFLEPAILIARGWVFLAWGLTFLMVSGGRLILRRVVYRMRARGAFLSRALIVGANPEARLLAEQLLRWRTSGLDLVGFVDGEEGVGAELMPGLRVVGSIANLESVIARYGVQELILASSALTRDDMLALFRRFGVSETIRLRMSSGLYEIITTGLSVKEFAYVPLVGVNRVRLTGIDRALKAALDYSITLGALAVLLPLLALVAILVRLESAGPVLHRRRVMGLNGRQFDAFKFRTMVVNGDEILAAQPELRDELARTHKLRDDPRVTRIGKILRRFSIDELPQLLNVVKGEMSLVGPRMISPEEMARYDQWGINLLTIRPGITGLWQVSGRSDLRYEDRVRLDMHYIRNWSIWLDLQLLWQTLPAVLRARGAY
jgi:exopolysaccharide biosynthesis polyprenyl glycosylphosphotransferase